LYDFLSKFCQSTSFSVEFEEKLNIMKNFSWGIALLGSIISGFILAGTLVGSKSAPQESAGCLYALCFAIIPFVFAMAIQFMSENDYLKAKRKYEAKQRAEAKVE